jgi:hypothetical protein
MSFGRNVSCPVKQFELLFPRRTWSMGNLVFLSTYSSASSFKKLGKDNLFSFISFLNEKKNSRKGSNLRPLDC